MEMSFNRPAPGEALNFGEPTAPRPAATVVLLRDGDGGGLELLLVRRSDASRVMAGIWVFPGGSVDPADGEGLAGLRQTARRELLEEAGIALGDGHELVAVSRWITPEQVRRRFDTWFFVASAPPDAAVTVDGVEIVEYAWIAPARALAARSAERIGMILPTIKQLQYLAQFDRVADALAHARTRDVEPITPRVVEAPNADEPVVLLPGDPGY